MPMCGILITEKIDQQIVNLLRNRGLDSLIYTKYKEYHIYSSVLYLRQKIKQPIITKNFIFLYNGEIYDKSESDTLSICKMIEDTLSELKYINNYDDLIKLEDEEIFLQVLYDKLNNFQNEFGIVLVFRNKILFFKDDIGKRSIGVKNDYFCISSVKYDYKIDNLLFYSYDIQLRVYKVHRKQNFIWKYIKNCFPIDLYMIGLDYTNISEESMVQYEGDELSLDESIKKLDYLLKESTACRLHNDPIVVFFSGGIDSIIVALYLHLVSEQTRIIYLVNTGFSNSIDRINGLNAYKKLQEKYPCRKWILIENNLDMESIHKNIPMIRELVHPKISKMDINLGIVLHFTSICANKIGSVGYLGSGADELFGGYNKYKREAFKKKLMHDTLTISHRNLCRDDRVISNNNFEARLPFLDTRIIEFAFDLNSNFCMTETSNKFILRELLRFYGFNDLSCLPKKAMQYGTGLYKCEKQIYKY